jgi:hypothetical protein
MAGLEEQMGAGRGRLRASHADREHVIKVLKAAFVQGRLTKAEFDTRVDRAFAARVCADLAAVTADIPAGLIAQRVRASARARAWPRMSTAVWRRTIIVGLLAVLGLVTGAWLSPASPMLTSDAEVYTAGPDPAAGLSPATQAAMVHSAPVLTGALGRLDSAESWQALRGRVQAKSVTGHLLLIGAQGDTAVQAERTANAVAASFVAVVNSGNLRASGHQLAFIITQAVRAAHMPRTGPLLSAGGQLGALAGLLIGAIAVLATCRRARRT